MWNNHIALVEKIQRSIRRVVRSPGFQSAGQQTVAGLLRDWALLTLKRAWEGGMFSQTVGTLLDVMSHLTRTDLDEEEYTPYDSEEWLVWATRPRSGSEGPRAGGSCPHP